MKIEELYSFFLKANKVSTDSRKIEKNDLFFALKGDNFDGNKFAEQTILQGALAAIVDEKKYENAAKNIFFFENSLTALQDLARHHRKQLSIPIIGLTGSNGKTTSKELMASVLKEKYQVYYTQGNLNNHIGVPLTVLSIKPEHEMAIIEMGANHQKEIEFLCSISQPEIGYITNFGKAHLEGFGGEKGVIKGKSELYQYLRKNNKTVLVNTDDDKQVALTSDLQKITFGKNGTYHFSLIEGENHTVGIQSGDSKMLSKLTGNYNFANLCAAASLGFYFEIPSEKIKCGIENYEPQNQRSQIVQKENLTLVLDTYNANPSSMEASLRNFSTFGGSKSIIIGDMFELGETSDAEHQKIVDLAETLNFDAVYLLGEHFYKTKHSSGKIKRFQTTDEMKEFLKLNTIKTDNILLKGSRGMALEKLFEYLQ